MKRITQVKEVTILIGVGWQDERAAKKKGNSFRGEGDCKVCVMVSITLMSSF